MSTPSPGDPATPRDGSTLTPAGGACGPSWESVEVDGPSQHRNFLSGVSTNATDDAWAVGAAQQGAFWDSLAEHWDGSGWTIVSTPSVGIESFLHAVQFTSATRALAVGTYRDPDGKLRTLVLRADGAAWSVSPSPNVGTGDNVLNDIVVASPGEAWAVGYSDDGSGAIRTLGLRYRDGTWHISQVPNRSASGNYLEAVSASDPTHLWAVGAAYDPEIGNLQTLAVSYDGMTWALVPTPNKVPGTANMLLDVANTSSEAWAVGYANGLDGFEPIVTTWDGNTWSLANIPPVAGRLFGVAAATKDDVWAVGAAGRPTPLVVHWDGVGWRTIPTPGLSGDIVLNGVTSDAEGDLLAVGVLTEPGGQVTHPFVARLCESVVADSGFVDSGAQVLLGDTVVWAFSASNHLDHSVTDPTGLSLFDSGLRPPGGSFLFTFAGAGTYRAVDMTTGDHMRVRVPVDVSPSEGGIETPFLVRWASSAQIGYVFDVQVKRPGSASWDDWLVNQSAMDGTFLPDAGVGNYGFRARSRSLANGSSSAYSPPIEVTVQ
jgi:hypothetical protein